MNTDIAVIKAAAPCANSAALGAQAQIDVLREQLAAVLNRLRISVELANAYGYGVDLTRRDTVKILEAFGIPIRTYDEMGDYLAVRQGNPDGRARVAGTDRIHPGDLYGLIRKPKAV